MKNKNGFTLINILIFSSLMAVVLAASGKVYLSANRQLASLQGSVLLRNQLEAVGTAVSKNAVVSDTRFLAFSGLGPSNKSTFRFLIPQFGTCGDLSTTGCSSTAALIFPTYNKYATPRVTAICALPPTDWLVDLNNTDYGNATALLDGFSVSATMPGLASGKIGIAPNTLLGLQNPPTTSLWIAQGNPTKLNVSQDPITGAFLPSNPFAANPACLSELKVAASGPPTLYDLSKLYKVSVAPYIASQFTSGSMGVTATEMTAAAGTFPMGFFVASVQSIGIVPNTSPEKSKLTVRDCSYNSGTLVCSGTPTLEVAGVTRLRIDHSYQVDFPSGAKQFYEIAKTPAQKTCQESCDVLPLSTNASIPILANPLENIGNLDSNKYSFFKNDVLSRVRFRGQTAKKEFTFEMVFP